MPITHAFILYPIHYRRVRNIIKDYLKKLNSTAELPNKSLKKKSYKKNLKNISKCAFICSSPSNIQKYAI